MSDEIEERLRHLERQIARLQAQFEIEERDGASLGTRVRSTGDL